MSGQVLARFGNPQSLDAVDVAPAARERSIVTPETETRTMVQLTKLARNASGTVAGVRVHAPGVDGALDPADERMALRLIEIGNRAGIFKKHGIDIELLFIGGGAEALGAVTTV